MDLTGPRCRHPVKSYELRRYPDAPPDLSPVCWRPRGHPGRRHASYTAYMRALVRKRGYARPLRRASRELAA